LALAAMEDAAASAVDKIAAPAVLADEDTRTAATYALGRIGRIPADAEATIRANVTADDKVLSITSLWALARVHPDDKQFRAEAGEQLIERLKDKDAFVRAAAARALASLPPAPEIMLPLWEKAMQDADATTVQYALDAFVAMGPPAVPRLVDALKHEKVRGQVLYVLGKMGPAAAPATPELVKLLGDKKEEVAREAAIALANIGPGAKEAVPALVAGLQQGGRPNAYAMVYALGKIGPDAAAAEPVLTDLLENTDRKLALASAWALVHIRPGREVAAKTVPVLMAGLQSDMPLARQGAAEALGELGPLAGQAASALKKATEDEDKGVREAAAKALASVAGPNAGQ
jgi:HEAT repeat protein